MGDPEDDGVDLVVVVEDPSTEGVVDEALAVVVDEALVVVVDGAVVVVVVRGALP